MSELSGQDLRVAVALKLGFIMDSAAFGHWPNGVSIKLTLLPGYDYSLEAMAEAERTYVIPKKLGQHYLSLLDNECGDDYGTYHATATQRARALLKLP